jgi:hypothetical protein
VRGPRYGSPGMNPDTSARRPPAQSAASGVSMPSSRRMVSPLVCGGSNGMLLPSTRSMFRTASSQPHSACVAALRGASYAPLGHASLLAAIKRLVHLVDVSG